ncbi:MAG: hypothetical protein AABY22_34620 [Nanoarchaeota archaeon]
MEQKEKRLTAIESDLSAAKHKLVDLEAKVKVVQREIESLSEEIRTNRNIYTRCEQCFLRKCSGHPDRDGY